MPGTASGTAQPAPDTAPLAAPAAGAPAQPELPSPPAAAASPLTAPTAAAPAECTPAGAKPMQKLPARPPLHARNTPVRPLVRMAAPKGAGRSQAGKPPPSGSSQEGSDGGGGPAAATADQEAAPAAKPAGGGGANMKWLNGRMPRFKLPGLRWGANVKPLHPQLHKRRSS